MKAIENNVETQGSLTGIVWLPFQEKYKRHYKYVRYRFIDPSQAKYSGYLRCKTYADGSHSVDLYDTNPVRY